MTSCRRISSAPPAAGSIHDTSMSVASTRPLVPTRSARPRGTETPRAPPSTATLAEPHVVEVPERPRVEQLGERCESFTRLRATIVEQVAPVPQRGQERARRIVLRRLVTELHAIDVVKMTAESRGTVLDRRDVAGSDSL
jgi:hypothetical protein